MKVPVTVFNLSGEPIPATARVRIRSSKEAFWEGGKRSAKLVGFIALAILPFAFMEPFAFMVWGSIAFVILIFGLGPFLHLAFWSERHSFIEVEASCPNCKASGPLKPYISTRFDEEFTVLCSRCGQTTHVRRDATFKVEK